MVTVGDIRGLLRIKPRQKANIGKVRRHYDIGKRLEGHEVALRQPPVIEKFLLAGAMYMLLSISYFDCIDVT